MDIILSFLTKIKTKNIDSIIKYILKSQYQNIKNKLLKKQKDMKSKNFIPDSTVLNSADAKNFFFNKSGIKVNFHPIVINFYQNDEKKSSLCWQGKHKKLKHDVIISIIFDPLDAIQNPDKIEYIPLHKNDTIIIKNRIFTIKKENKNFQITELPFICSEQQAISAANILSENDTSKFHWRICEGTRYNNPIGYIWVGICIEDYEKTVCLPAFSSDQHILNLINDITPLNISDIITYKDSIYQICQKDLFFELKYLSSLTRCPSS
jgi:hypothetical protein